jgi:hypothetical protein
VRAVKSLLRGKIARVMDGLSPFAAFGRLGTLLARWRIAIVGVARILAARRQPAQQQREQSQQ